MDLHFYRKFFYARSLGIGFAYIAESSPALPAHPKNYFRTTSTAISVPQPRTGRPAALPHAPDEWILKALGRLPGIDEPLPQAHSHILASRTQFL